MRFNQRKGTSAASSGRQAQQGSSIKRRLGAGAVGVALALAMGSGIAEAQDPTNAELQQILNGTHELVKATATTTIDGVTETHNLVFVVEKNAPGALLVLGGNVVAKGPVPPPVPPRAPDNGGPATGGTTSSAGSTSVAGGK